MDALPGTGIPLIQSLEDAGFTVRQASRLAGAAGGADAAEGSRSATETTALIREALDDLHFPSGRSAERRRAELWSSVFPESGPTGPENDDGSGTRGPGFCVGAFCLGVAAVVLVPVLPVAVAVLLVVGAVVLSVLGLNADASTVHPGLRALATTGLVLGTIAAILLLSALVTPSPAPTIVPVPVQ